METPKAKAVMQEYLKTHKIDGYFDAYRARLTNNHHVLLEVAEEMKKLGFVCYAASDSYKNEATRLVYAIRDNECVTFGFAEVPYRWYIDSEYRFTCGLIGEHGYDYPFDIEDILKHVGPNRFGKDYFNSKYWMKL